MPSTTTQFKPGRSGNPGGRPKGVAARARELAGGDSGRLLAVLLEIAEDQTARPADRIAAAREYLDRGWGRSHVAGEAEMSDAVWTVAEIAEIDRRIAILSSELAARTGDSDVPN